MAIPDDIQEYVEKNIKLMISQTETYLPFIKIAFPYSQNLADGVYNLIIGNALSVFINQYAMRMKYPSAEDFADFHHSAAGAALSHCARAAGDPSACAGAGSGSEEGRVARVCDGVCVCVCVCTCE